MKARIIKQNTEQKTNTVLYRIVREPAEMHGFMRYRCQSCGKIWNMNLEIGVEDNGNNGRPHQPCPFIIPCDCGGIARDVSGYIPYPMLRPSMFSGQRYFAYDHSGKEDACGIMSVYLPCVPEGAKEQEADNG